MIHIWASCDKIAKLVVEESRSIIGGQDQSPVGVTDIGTVCKDGNQSGSDFLKGGWKLCITM